jgi:cysteine desulfurase
VQHGGAHERNRRAGTENVPGIVGFGAALRLAGDLMAEEAARLRRWRDRLRDTIASMPGAHVHGDPEDALPGTVSASFEGTDSESLLMALDFRGIAASSGSACTSGSLEPSHVLRAIGVPPELARGTVRLSLGRMTTEEQVEYLIAALGEVVEQLRH